MTDGPADTVKGWRPSPRAQQLLLPPGSPVTLTNGEEVQALGTGVVVLVGSARSGKSTLAWALMEWVAERTERRDFALVGLPPVVLEALPPGLRKRTTCCSIQDLPRLRDCVAFLDDTAVYLNSRDAMGGGAGLNRTMSRLAGIISHLGVTLLVTAQSMALVDLAVQRATEVCCLVLRVDPLTLEAERPGWRERIEDAQDALRPWSMSKSHHWSVSDALVCASPWPSWMRPDPTDPRRADLLSRPFRYMAQADLDHLVSGPAKPSRVTHTREDQGADE